MRRPTIFKSIAATIVTILFSSVLGVLPASADPAPTVTGNYPRLYQDARNVYLPQVTGVDETYYVIYRENMGILGVRQAIGNLDSARSITWDDLDPCLSPGNHTITVEVISLTAIELDNANDGCQDTPENRASVYYIEANPQDYAARVVASTTFEFRQLPIPRATVRFRVTQPTDSQPVIHEQTFFDGDAPQWYDLGLENDLDPNTFATFDRWVEVTNLDQEIELESDEPLEGHEYKAIWLPYETPLDPFSVDIAGQVITNPDASMAIVWTGDSLDTLPVTLRMAPNTTWNLVLSAANNLGQVISQDSLDGLESFLQEENNLNIRNLDGCSVSPMADSCPKNLVLKLITAHEGQTKIFTFHIMRESSADTATLTYVLENPSYVADSETNGWSSIQSSSAASPRWASVGSPIDLFGLEDWQPDAYFGGWCTTQQPTSFDACYNVGDFIPVSSDVTLYSLWVPSAAPESFRVGRVNINPDNAVDWLVDNGNHVLYVTVESTPDTELFGDVAVVGPTGIQYNAALDEVSSPLDEIGPDENGDYLFETGCYEAGACIYYLRNYFQADPVFWTQRPFGSQYFGIYLIVKPATNDLADVSFNLGAGASLPAQDLTFGWHVNPAGPFTRQGYIAESTWDDDITTDWGGWDSHFPVLTGQTQLSLQWEVGPVTTAVASRTITLGQTEVTTATADDVDATWRVTGTSDFSITSTGVISARANLPAGVYTFDVSAETWIEGPRVRMTVTVEAPVINAPSEVQGPSQGSGGGGSSTPSVGAQPAPTPTDKPVEVKPEPKPVLLQQPSATASVARAKLGVGATTNVSIRGGLANGVVTYSSSNPKICSVDARGSVTAKSVGTCLVTAQVSTSDPAYAPTATAPIRIAVLRQGLVDSATLKVNKGSVTVVASLLKKHAGKKVSLFQVANRSGKPALVPIGWATLDKNAVAAFKPFKRDKSQVKLVVMLAGKKVYELTSK